MHKGPTHEGLYLLDFNQHFLLTHDFSQNTSVDTVTLNEAGAAPVRGQRSFNTALEPVDFSFSTYIPT